MIPAIDHQIFEAGNFTPASFYYKKQDHIEAKLISSNEPDSILGDESLSSTALTTNTNAPSLVKATFSVEDLSSIESIAKDIFEKINFPIAWEQEGVEKPNLASKSRAFDICKAIFFEYNFLPNKVAPTKEVGIYLSYENKSQSKSLIIEIYNNLEVAAIVTNNSKRTIEYSEDVYGLQLDNVVKVFNS